MTVNEFIKKLQAYGPEFREKDIRIASPNGLLFSPVIKVVLKNEFDILNHSAENVDFIVITGE